MSGTKNSIYRDKLGCPARPTGRGNVPNTFAQGRTVKDTGVIRNSFVPYVSPEYIDELTLLRGEVAQMRIEAQENEDRILELQGEVGERDHRIECHERTIVRLTKKLAEARG